MIKKNLPFLTIIVFSLLLRLYSLTSIPLFGDEIDIGYQAHSLLHTLKDIRGNFLPFYADSLAESRAPAIIYLTIPSVALFGLNSFAVRIVPLIFGLISIIVFYKLVLLISKSRSLSLYSAAILAFSPWHIHYSRTGFELTTLSSFVLIGIYTSLLFVQKQNRLMIYLSAIFFSLTFYTYNTANIFTPLIILFTYLLNRKSFPLNKLIAPIILGTVLISPIILSILSGNAANRFKLISIFNDPQIINQIIDNRTDFTSSTSPLIEKIFHNKAIAYTQYFFKNYLGAFSPNFIFTTGDPNPRHNLPNYGLLLLPCFIPLIYGLKKSHPFFIFWLIVAPISSALTQGGSNHASRLFLMVFPLSYFVAVGLESFSVPIRKTLTFIITVFLAIHLHQYFTHYPKAYFANWQYGYHQLFSYQPNNSNRIFVSNTKYESLERYAFFQQIDPNIFQSTSDKEQDNIIDNLSGFKLGTNVFFVNHWPSSDSLGEINKISQSGDIFYLLQGTDIPGDMDLTKQPLKKYRTLRTVYYPNGQIMGQIIQKE